MKQSEKKHAPYEIKTKQNGKKKRKIIAAAAPAVTRNDIETLMIETSKFSIRRNERSFQSNKP